MQSLKHETQADFIAEAMERMKQNTLRNDIERRGSYLDPLCSCGDKDNPHCPIHGIYTRQGTQAIQAQAEAIAELRMELIEEMNGLGPINSDDPQCLNCKTTENLRDGDECFACYDMRLHDAEMFARHGGDV